MLGTIILRFLLFVLFMGLLCILLITFLNRRSAKADSKLYDPHYRPDELSDYETHESIESEANERSTSYYRLDLKRK
jgi:hypothetical protein